MAQAWHKQRQQVELVQHAQGECWRATDYKLDNLDNPTVIEAAPDAVWERYSPFGRYKPTSKAREVEAGPHLSFLKLKGVRYIKPHLFLKALIVFAKEYGLLGAFEDDYWPRFIVNNAFVAPDAVIDRQGRLWRVDPATKGRELLLALFKRRSGLHMYPTSFARHKPRREMYQLMALPSDIKLASKYPERMREPEVPFDDPVQIEQPVPWEIIQEDFGALVILDEEAPKGISVLCTREPLDYWRRSLRFFPSGEMPAFEIVESQHTFNWHLNGLSPYVFLGENGDLEPGWDYRSLLQSMYLMLYLDLTGDNSIKKCQSLGCPNYFRIGPQSKSKYCSPRCANRASTRMGRGQEP